MIVTVTMNPSIDVSYPLTSFKLDTVNRVAKVSKTAGGKGLNVTRVLHELGGEVIATGVIGGHHGAFIMEQLDMEGISHRFSPIKEESRNSIAILHEGKQTEILESGPTVSAAEQSDFLELFKDLLSGADCLTISGSLAKGFPSDFYQTLLNLAGQVGVKALVDTSGETLKQSLLSEQKPYLIKPNAEEIQELLGQRVSLEDLSAFKAALRNELFTGVEWVIVSLGAQGAVVKHQQDIYRVSIPKITAVNPVGSGDATLAGLAYGISRQDDPETTIKTAMTTGILNTLEKKTGHINRDNFEQYFSQIQVEKI